MNDSILNQLFSDADTAATNEILLELPSPNPEIQTNEFQSINSPDRDISQNTGSDTIILEDNELLQLLNSWNLKGLYSYFLIQNINMEILQLMRRSHIKELLKDFSWGEIIKFEHCLGNWRNAMGKPLENVCEPSSIAPEQFKKSETPLSIRSSSPESTSASSVTLATILNNSRKGIMLTDYYQKYNNFKPEHRSMLITTIARYFDERNIHLNLKSTYNLEREIIERFPTEKMEFYRCGIRGKIYYKYCNLKCNCKLKQDKTPVIKKSEERKYVMNDDIKAQIQSLKYDNLSVAEFERIWMSCIDYRLQEIRSKPTTDVFKTWPQYKKPIGYRLIDIDFNYEFKNNASSLDEWPEKLTRIQEFLLKENRIKDKNVKATLNELKQKTNLTDDQKAAAVLWSIHSAVPPTSKAEAVKGAGKKHRHTIMDSQESFICIKSNVNQLEEHLQSLQGKAENIQPHLLAIGEDILTITEFLLYFDGVKYRFTNFLRAVDICFKTFFLFNLEYPPAGYNFWSFVQRYFYKINSGKKNSSVEILLSDLEN